MQDYNGFDRLLQNQRLRVDPYFQYFSHINLHKVIYLQPDVRTSK
jgi:hypothetical protein